MSTNYSDQTLLAYAKTTGTDDSIAARIGTINQDILVNALHIIVNTAGAETDTKIVLETDESTPVVLAEQTVGTDAAKTSYEVKVAESLRLVSAGTGLQVRVDSPGNDASSVCYVSVFGTYPHM